jgi:hypothetical protein
MHRAGRIAFLDEKRGPAGPVAFQFRAFIAAGA